MMISGNTNIGLARVYYLYTETDDGNLSHAHTLCLYRDRTCLLDHAIHLTRSAAAVLLRTWRAAAHTEWASVDF